MSRAFLARWRWGYYRRCLHRSHRLGLACWRGQTYDHQCGKHNDTCFNTCAPAAYPPVETPKSPQVNDTRPQEPR